MNDSSARESALPAREPDDPRVAALPAALRHFRASELACCAALALLARELSGGRRCRVVCSVDGTSRGGRGDLPDRDAPTRDDPGWHREPVRAPGSTGAPEARLAVELHDDERTPPGLDRLAPFVSLAALALERHRLGREARRAREDAEEVRAVLGHALRGHLHAALLRADNMLLGLRKDASPDLDEVREQLEALKDTVEDMVAEIRDVVEVPDDEAERFRTPTYEPQDGVRVPGLLREAGGREAGDDSPPPVEVAGEVPAVRVDPDQLGRAFGELYDLARRSRSTPTLTVRPDGSAAGVRVRLAVELPPLYGPAGGPQGQGADAGPSPPDADPGGSDGSESEVERPSLPELVAGLGGRLWVEAGEGGRAEVVVTLPAGGPV